MSRVWWLNVMRFWRFVIPIAGPEKKRIIRIVPKLKKNNKRFQCNWNLLSGVRSSLDVQVIAHELSKIVTAVLPVVNSFIVIAFNVENEGWYSSVQVTYESETRLKI